MKRKPQLRLEGTVDRDSFLGETELHFCWRTTERSLLDVGAETIADVFHRALLGELQRCEQELRRGGRR